MSIVTKDDVFLIGNIGMMGVIANRGEEIAPMLEFVKTARPQNAGGFIVEALHLYSSGETEAALVLMEDVVSLDMEANRDEALAFHTFLLMQNGKTKEAHTLAQAYLEDQIVTTPEAKATIEEILKLTSAMVEPEDLEELEELQV